MSFCNNQLYAAWTGLDDHINVGWGSTGLGFSNVVTYSDTAYAYSNIYTSPALACWQAASGTWSDKPRLWITFTGANEVIYLGYFNGTGDNGQRLNLHVPVVDQNGKSQTSNFSPVMSVQGGTLRIGWTGVSNGYLNYGLTVNAYSWNPVNTWKSQESGAGFGMALYCPNGSGSCNLYFAWPGIDNPSHLNIGYYGLTGPHYGTFYAIPGDTAIQSDTTCSRCDLTLLPQSGGLDLPYSGADLNIVVDTSPDGRGWNKDLGPWPSVWGAGGAVITDNHLWITYVNHNTDEIVILQYN